MCSVFWKVKPTFPWWVRVLANELSGSNNISQAPGAVYAIKLKALRRIDATSARRLACPSTHPQGPYGAHAMLLPRKWPQLVSAALPLFLTLSPATAYEVPVSDADYDRQICSGMWAGSNTFINGAHAVVGPSSRPAKRATCSYF